MGGSGSIEQGYNSYLLNSIRKKKSVHDDVAAWEGVLARARGNFSFSLIDLVSEFSVSFFFLCLI